MQFDREGHFDCFGLRNAIEVDMQNFNAKRIPLDFPQQRGVRDVTGQSERILVPWRITSPKASLRTLKLTFSSPWPYKIAGTKP